MMQDNRELANSERRANVAFGPECLTQGYPLQYAPRYSNDNYPWIGPFRIRWANCEVNERGAA